MAQKIPSKEKRKQAEKFFLAYLEEIAPGNKNIEMYKKLFKSWSDEYFHEVMLAIRDGKYILPYIQTPLDKVQVDTDRVFNIAKKYDIEFFDHLIYTDPATGARTKTPNKYFIVELPVRRQSQHLEKGLAVSTDYSSINVLTGQVTTKSKTTKMSLPETVVLESQGLHNALLEFLKTRGGDLTALNYARQSLRTKGEYNIDDVLALNTRPQSVKVLKYYIAGMHFNNNL